jgi:hypothetical protein
VVAPPAQLVCGPGCECVQSTEECGVQGGLPDRKALAVVTLVEGVGTEASADACLVT